MFIVFTKDIFLGLSYSFVHLHGLFENEIVTVKFRIENYLYSFLDK